MIHKNKWIKRARGLFFLCLGLVLTISFFTLEDLTEKKGNKESISHRYNQFVDNHPYSQSFSEEEWLAMPKYDRPDLAARQNYLSMLDPNTLTVPYHRMGEAYEYTKNRLAISKQIKQNLNPGPFKPGMILRKDAGTSFQSVPFLDKPEAITVGGREVVWEEQGPNNIGGRTRAILWDPNDPTNRAVFAAGVAGGIWHNSNVLDPNSSWVAINDFLGNLAVVTLAADPTNSDVIYAGTGEGYFGGGMVRGAGIFKSTDGGDTWSVLPSTEIDDFAYVQKIVVTNTGAVLATTRGTGAPRDLGGGVYLSEDGGDTWDEKLAGNGSDIEIASNGDIYVTRGIFTPGMVDKSEDGGNTWTSITPDADPVSLAFRIELATAPSNSEVVYAMAQDSVTNNIDWVRKSIDGGANWVNMTIPTHNDGCAATATGLARTQAWYDLILAVDPNNEDVVIAGGIDLARTSDGGATWTQISEWLDCSAIENVHADQHQIVFRPDNSGAALFGTDGGVYYSPNAGIAETPSFEPRNKNYSVTQFYAVATDNVAGSEYFIAGAQDNGTLKLETGSAGIAVEVFGGDGAFCHVDQQDRTFQVGSSQFGAARHSTNGGISFTRLNTVNGGTQNGGNFINQTDYDNTHGILYSAKLDDQYARITGLKTTTPTDEVVIDINLGGRQVSAIRANANEDNRIFIGTEGGLVLRVDNAHDDPESTNITSNITTVGNVSSIDIGSSDDELIVTYSNFGVTSIWYTTDGGDNWVSKDEAAHGLPDIPIRWALFNPLNPSQVMIATELGVWSTNNITASNPGWEPSNEGLANVKCDMLQYRESDGLVVVATHGRGIFTTNIFSATQDETGPVAFSFTPAHEEVDVQFLDAALEIQFNETVTLGSGDITLKLLDNDDIVETIAVTGGQVVTTGLTATITLSSLLNPNTSYYIEVAPGAFEDNLGNPFSGISGNDTWSFTTFDGDLLPTVLVPISNQSLEEGSAPIVLDLTNVFDDQDNDNLAIVKEIVSNSAEEVVQLSITDNDLTITPVTDAIGLAAVTIKGTSNGKEVEDSFIIEVNSIAEKLFVQTGADNNGRLEGAYTEGTTFRNADDFVVTGGQNWSITTVTTEAFYLGSNPLDLQSVEVVVYADDSGTPDESNVIATQTVLTGNGQLIGGEATSPGLTVRLNTPIDLTPGTYWISIFPTFGNDSRNADGSFDAVYVWFVSPDGGNSFFVNADGNYEAGDDAMLFTVDGERDIFDFAPEVANAIDDVEYSANIGVQVIDISNVFTDPDHDDDAIVVEIVGNTNEDLLSTELVSDELRLTITADQGGSSVVTLRATSNGLVVEERFEVNVLFDLVYEQTGVADGSSPSQVFTDFGNAALETADDFVVTDGEVWDIRQVAVAGDRRSPDQAFFIIYEDNGGVPGDIIFFSGVLVPTLTDDDTDFRLTSPNVASLNAGTYWVSVQVVQPFDGSTANQWFWQRTSPAVGNDYAIQDVNQLLGGGFPNTWGASGNNSAMIFSVRGETSNAPLTPSDLDISYDGSDISLSWTDNSDNEIEFVIERSANGGVFEEVGRTAGTTYSSVSNTVSPITSNVEYTYRVYALGASNSSGFSNTDSQLTLPEPPISLASPNVGEDSFELSWVSVNGTLDFKVDVSTDNFATFVREDQDIAGNNLSVDGLDPNQEYQVRIQAVNATGSSVESEVLEVTTLPSAPTSLVSSNIATDRFDLTWASEDGASSFRLDVSTDGFSTFVFENLPLVETSASISGLSSNVTYEVRLRSVNEVGNSIESEVLEVTTLPVAPVSLLSSNIKVDAFDLTWTSDDEANEFSFDLSTDGFTTFVQEDVSVSGTSVSITELNANTTYEVRVRSVNESGSSVESEVLVVTTLFNAPTAEAASNLTGDSFQANWTVTDGATAFEVDVSQDGFETFVAGFDSKEVEGTSIEVTELEEGDYVYRVRALNASGPSASSNTIEVSIEKPLGVDELVGGINLYPNPSNEGRFYVDYQRIPGMPLSAKVYTIAGREIKSLSFEDLSGRYIDLSDQPDGTFIINLIRGDIQRQITLIKQP